MTHGYSREVIHRFAQNRYQRHQTPICHEETIYFLFSEEIERKRENTGTLNDRSQPSEIGYKQECGIIVSISVRSGKLVSRSPDCDSFM